MTVRLHFDESGILRGFWRRRAVDFPDRSGPERSIDTHLFGGIVLFLAGSFRTVLNETKVPQARSLILAQQHRIRTQADVAAMSFSDPSDATRFQAVPMAISGPSEFGSPPQSVLFMGAASLEMRPHHNQNRRPLHPKTELLSRN